MTIEQEPRRRQRRSVPSFGRATSQSRIDRLRHCSRFDSGAEVGDSSFQSLRDRRLFLARRAKHLATAPFARERIGRSLRLASPPGPTELGRWFI